MEGATQYFEAAITKAKTSAGGRATVEGPHSVPFSKTVGSIRMTLEALRSIQARVQTIDETYLNQVCPKSLVTLIVEHFNSKMREVHDVPSVLRYAHQFSAAVEETVKRTTQCGFNYFTNPRSYYEVPDGMVSFGDLPKLPRPPKHPCTTQEVTELRKWAQEYQVVKLRESSQSELNPQRITPEPFLFLLMAVAYRPRIPLLVLRN